MDFLGVHTNSFYQQTQQPAEEMNIQLYAPVITTNLVANPSGELLAVEINNPAQDNVITHWNIELKTYANGDAPEIQQLQTCIENLVVTAPNGTNQLVTIPVPYRPAFTVEYFVEAVTDKGLISPKGHILIDMDNITGVAG